MRKSSVGTTLSPRRDLSGRNSVLPAKLKPLCAIRGEFPLPGRAALLQFSIREASLPSPIDALVHERLSAAAKELIGLRKDSVEVLFHVVEGDSLQDCWNVLFLNRDLEMLRDPANLPLGI